MPNWCSTEITLTCNSEDEARKLSDMIYDWSSSDKMPNDFGHDWLGNIVLGSGIGTVDDSPKTDVRCRGYITDMWQSGNTVRISTETAWTPMLRMWLMILEKYSPDTYIEYEAVEPGCQIYATSESVNRGMYYIDVWDGDTLYCERKDSAKCIMQKLLKSSEEDFERLVDEFEEAELGVCHEWEIVPVTEWD